MSGISGEFNGGQVLTGSGSSLNAVILSAEVTFIESIFVQLTGTFSATVTFQGSNDQTNWVNVLATDSANANTAPFSSTSSTGLFSIPANFSFFRLIITSYTSGTVNASVLITEGSTSSISPRTVKAQLQDNSGTGLSSTLVSSKQALDVNVANTIQVQGNVASGAADSGNPVKIGGVYNSTLPVVTTGQRVDLQLDSNGRLLTSTSVTSSLPAATFSKQTVITNGITTYTSFTASQKLALKQFYAGGTGIGKQVLYSYSPTSSVFINGGDFENAGDVGTIWTWTSVAGTGSVAQSSAQAFTGTKSCALTFSNSSGNNAQGVKQTFSSPQDFSVYRYVQAYFYNTVSAGGAYTRTISIILTDSGGSTYSYAVSGSSTTAPFNASRWIQILGEIVNPTSVTGTAFDTTAVVSMELRMADSGNKSGTVYWDTVKLVSSITPIFPIYHQANSSFNIAIDPVFIMNIGDQIVIAQTNNDTAKKEYFASAGGVSTT